MVAITRALAPSAPFTGRSARPSPELDANLRTCRAQMADWVTCPSAKTPEGKAKIAQISTRLESIKQEIKKSDVPSPSAPSPERDAQIRPSVSDSAQANYLDDHLNARGQVGGNVDIYA